MSNSKKGGSIFESKGWKTGMKYLYGLGAAVVIIGALFKILHLPGADFALIVGLTTEAVIFFFSAFEPLPHEDVHWEWDRVYPIMSPEISRDEIADKIIEAREQELQKATLGSGTGGGGGGAALHAPKMDPKDLEKIMQLTPTTFTSFYETVSSLKNSVGNLTQGVDNMSNIADVAGSASDFAGKLQTASGNIDKLAVGYSTSAETMTKFNAALSQVQANQELISKETAAYQTQVSAAAKNLTNLNAVYEIELQDAQKHISSITKFYGSIAQVMDNLLKSSQDTDNLRQEVSVLAKNMRTLNTVYGNMLTAMASGAGAKA